MINQERRGTHTIVDQGLTLDLRIGRAVTYALVDWRPIGHVKKQFGKWYCFASDGLAVQTHPYFLAYVARQKDEPSRGPYRTRAAALDELGIWNASIHRQALAINLAGRGYAARKDAVDDGALRLLRAIEVTADTELAAMLDALILQAESAFLASARALSDYVRHGRWPFVIKMDTVPGLGSWSVGTDESQEVQKCKTK